MIFLHNLLFSPFKSSEMDVSILAKDQKIYENFNLTYQVCCVIFVDNYCYVPVSSGVLVYEQCKSRYICRKTNTGPEFGVFTKSIVICPGLEGVDSSGRWGAKLGRAVAVNQWVNNSAVLI